MANSLDPLLDTLPTAETAAVGEDIIQLSALLDADEGVRAITAGMDATGAPLLLAVTERRVLTVDHSIPLGEVTSIATSGTVHDGGTLTIYGEEGTVRATNIAFPQAQRFVAAVRAGVARAEAATPSWLPTQRGEASRVGDVLST